MKTDFLGGEIRRSWQFVLDYDGADRRDGRRGVGANGRNWGVL